MQDKPLGLIGKGSLGHVIDLDLLLCTGFYWWEHVLLFLVIF